MRWRAVGVANADDYQSRVLPSEMQTISNFVKNKYGYDTGSWTDFPADKSDNRFMVKLDWNINNDHRVALRYNYAKNLSWTGPNGTSMDGGTRMPSYRTSQNAMSFANSMYSSEKVSKSWSLDFNSRFSNTIQNQLLATYSEHNDVRGTNSSDFPFIDILDGHLTATGKGEDNYIALGYELFTYNNGVHNKVLNIKDDVNIELGKHKVLLGAYYEHQMADNAYMRNGTGYYRYQSMDDFMNGAAPDVVCLTYGYGGETNPAARVTFNKAAIYGQDNWTINEKFKLTYGIRFDGLFFNNKDLMTNKAILDLDYNGRHIDTGKWPSAGLTISPRIGFNYDIFADKSLVLRGGTGFFAGRIPLVYFTNMPTNGGMVQYQAQLSAKNTDMSQFAGGLVKEEGKSYGESLLNKLQSMGYPSDIKPEDGTVPSSICAVDPKFKMPQVWKTTLALDYQIPVSFPFTATVEGVFIKTLNDVCISDWSIKPVGGFARFNGVDNRPIYPDNFRSGKSAFVLENTSKGYGWTTTINLKARPTKWLSLEAAYKHEVKKELTSMPGSAAESAFTYVPTVEGPNYIRLHNALNVTPNRWFVSAGINDKSGNHFNFIFEGFQASEACSFMMMNDMNGDGSNYDAIYVPTDGQVGVGTGDFRFKTQDDLDRFMAYVHNNSYLSKHQGKYAEAYSVNNPWVHRLDFAYKHDFNFKVGPTSHKFQLSADIKNLLNLFNSSWGVMKTLNTDLGTQGAARILKYEGADKDGYATFSTPKAVNGDTKTFISSHLITQCWYMSIGIKYFFN